MYCKILWALNCFRFFFSHLWLKNLNIKKIIMKKIYIMYTWFQNIFCASVINITIIMIWNERCMQHMNIFQKINNCTLPLLRTNKIQKKSNGINKFVGLLPKANFFFYSLLLCLFVNSICILHTNTHTYNGWM